MPVSKVKVGVVGCGNISGTYLKNAKTLKNIEIVAVADLVLERARAKAAEYGVGRACSVRELLADPEIEIVVNLTVPRAHAPVALAALKAGKSVYNEKPLALRLQDSRRMLRLARSRHLLVGCAPDTFLGAAGQTARKLIDDGVIGRPVGASAFMMCHGHEHWHPDPEFYYQPGGGPLFDMGPYYLTALVNLMGPVTRVTGSARITFPTRTITSRTKYGRKIVVRTPTHIASVLDFASGAVATLITSFDVWASETPKLEIYGTEGSLGLPSPNDFGGPVRLFRPGQKDWKTVRPTHPKAENLRGLGVADMAAALRSGRSHRANGELAAHVLEIMHAILSASRLGRHVRLKSSCERPRPLPTGLRKGQVDK